MVAADMIPRGSNGGTVPCTGQRVPKMLGHQIEGQKPMIATDIQVIDETDIQVIITLIFK